jgi:hypothetical protein
MLKTVCYDTPMKHKLAYVTLCLTLGSFAGCGDDEPKPGPTGGRGGDAGPTGGTGGTGGMMGGTGGMTGGTGGMTGGTGGATDGPREVAPGTDGPSTDAPGGTPMANVTPAGKRLVSADGRLTIDIPPGAFRGPTDVEITVVSSPPGGALGAVYEIEPVNEPLLLPARVTFKYTAAELAGGKPSDLRIGLRVEDAWQSLTPTAADAATTEIRSQLGRLGVIGLLPGLCDVCDATCDVATCKFAVTEANPAGVAGKCFTHGKGCNRCVPVCDGDGDGFCSGDPPNGEPGDDCADDDPARYPGAREICGNLIDDDCDTHLDEGCKTCTAHNQCPSSLEACIDGICDVCEGGCTPAECVFGADPDMMIPGMMGRCQSYGNGCSACVPMCDADGDGFCADPPAGFEPSEKDCNDTNADQSPSKKEICGNGVDDDCNGSIDDLCNDCENDDDCPRDLLYCRNGACTACATGCTAGAACTFQVGDATGEGKCERIGKNDSCGRCVPTCDNDADGYCDGNPPAGTPGDDCRPDDSDVNPGAIEVCGNEQDDNCNGQIDEGCTRCAAHATCPVGQACVNRTCEACETTCVVAECRFGEIEGQPGSGVMGRCAAFGMGCQRCVPTCDTDGDGLCPGTPANDQPGGDCDDANATTYTGAPEICGNRVDDNCDGRKDEDCAATTCSASAMCGNNESCSTDR